LYLLEFLNLDFLTNLPKTAQKRQTVSNGSIRFWHMEFWRGSPNRDQTWQSPFRVVLRSNFRVIRPALHSGNQVSSLKGIKWTGRVQGDTTRTNSARAKSAGWRKIRPRTEVGETSIADFGAYQHIRLRVYTKHRNSKQSS